MFCGSTFASSLFASMGISNTNVSATPSQDAYLSVKVLLGEVNYFGCALHCGRSSFDINARVGVDAA
jgi:hypothetical protein